MNGVLNILKPTGMSSHDVVGFIRKTLSIKKVGHAGTLDPNVAGVLPICVGKATKFSDYLINGDKEYICEIVLGKSTDTQDMYGKIIDECNSIILDEIDDEAIINAINLFKGNIKQVPPAFSAVKYKGKKLYEYARQDIIIEKEARDVTIKDLQILKIDKPRILIRVNCSKGTYMRTLCHDIGLKLGTFAHMGILIRTQAKGLKIEDSITLDEIRYYKEINELHKCFISVDDIVPMKKVFVDDEHYEKLVVGNEINLSLDETYIENFYVYCKNILVGIGHRVNNEQIKINKLLINR
ncbi:tRNA pseudouridine(55) synthase TruB [Sedimentibacter sp. zth1]|uniref:tRNA pseudouridine(55) synthase TruB n=1 Tax=Sedimentibacter sp. zth1 TaxID=2816908 RepID=UPI001A916ADE|nr:tRNA pseudouridine(55) synthase TruB [Sedimentibacter sp. zth1]QSX06542.1 tRNA pseudouridine(55) synthase TruB [Sedimentibacter sp. zth1]